MISFPLVIAHRGDSIHALENSLEAMGLALELGVDMIEFDVHRSLDGGLFVMHDGNTGRTANAAMDIEAATVADLARLSLKNGEKIPTLRDVLSLVSGKASLNIEIKSAGAGVLVAAELAAVGYSGGILVSSFLEKEVETVRKAAPNLPVAVVYDRFTVRDVASCRDKGYELVSLNKRAVTNELLRECLREGVGVYVWTVDERYEMERLISWGVDGIFTNDPGLLLDVVSELKDKKIV